MELVIVMLLVFSGVIATDQYFDINKSERCAEVTRFQSNDLEIDYCLAQGKIEQGNAQLKDVHEDIKKIQNMDEQ